MTTPQAVGTAQAAQTQQVRARVLAVLVAAWLGLRSWRSDDDVQRFLSTVLPVVLAGQQAVATLTEAALTQAYAALTGAPARALGVPMDAVTGAATRGVPPEQVYRRPFVQTWTALSRGKDFPTALAQGQRRLESLAATDLQLAKTHTARAALAQMPGITSYRRVLQGPHSCALCVVASTNIYHRGNLMPIHPGCDCGIMLVRGETGRPQIDQATLAAAHAAVRERFGRSDNAAKQITSSDGDTLAYRDLLIVHEHGEIGPVLGVRGQQFTGPADIPG